MLPLAESESKSMSTSHSSAVSTGTDDPPGITALSGRSSRSIPPPRSWINSRSGSPMGASYTPGRLTWPLSA